MENKNFASYETLFIVDLSKGDENAKNVVSKFINLIAENGILTSVNEWGKRRLAYPINDINEGYYVLATFNAAHDFPAELQRLFNINDGIMRSMITATEPKEGIAVKYEPKAIVTEEAPAAEEPEEAVAEEVAETPVEAETPVAE